MRRVQGDPPDSRLQQAGVTRAPRRSDGGAAETAASEVPAISLPMLMVLRLKGRATCETMATDVGATRDELRTAVIKARAAGLVQPVPTAVGARDRRDAVETEMWTLGAAGHTTLHTLLARESIDHAALAGAYEGFLAVDARLKAAITDWQLASADATQPKRQLVLCDAGTHACAEAERLARLVPRYAPYVRRLSTALDRLRGGDDRFAAGSRVDSLHQVWFELHQDLLLTLGRERGT